MSTPRTKEYLIALFTVNGPPYMLQYRKLGHARLDWKADLPILKELIKEGKVKEIDRTRTTILYKYYPNIPI